MKRLQENRIETLRKYLLASKMDSELFPEMLDHLACEAEEGLWDGKTFEQAYNGIVESADPQTLLFLGAETKYLLAMDKSLNDIVFEGRNKQYGAYALRNGYKQTMQKSVLLGVTIFLVLIMLPDLYARLVPEKKATDIAYIVEARPINIKPEKQPERKVIPEAAKPVETTVKSKAIVVLPDPAVEEDYTPPTTTELETGNPGQETVVGTGDIALVEKPVEVVAKIGENTVIEKPGIEEVTFAEQSPAYNGGMDAMSAFLQKNLRYPSQASRVGVQGRVFVQFTVGSDGKIENVRSIKGIGFGCDEEAERVVKLMPSWKPGKQSGRAVRVSFTLPISFQLE